MLAVLFRLLPFSRLSATVGQAKKKESSLLGLGVSHFWAFHYFAVFKIIFYNYYYENVAKVEKFCMQNIEYYHFFFIQHFPYRILPTNL